MPRIDVPADPGVGTDRFAAILPVQAEAYQQMTAVVFSNTTVPPRERECARMVIAMINDCQVCQSFRVPGLERKGVDEAMYAAVADWRHAEGFTPRERLAAEYAERFALDHMAMDDDFWVRMRAEYTDAQIAELSLMIAGWLGFGRMTAVLQLDR